MKKSLFLIKIVLSIALAVVLLQITFVENSQAAQPATASYRVQYGDTLFSIGRRYGVNPYRIAEANGIVNPNYIYAGQMLYIPTGYGYQNPNQGWNNPNQGWNHPNQNWNNCNNCSGYNYGGYYGYDYTGYYYTNQPQNRRYSYTCGYHYNCY